MPAPQGPQWVRLYRGLHATEPEDVDTKELGLHWTDSPTSAYNFATYRDVEGWPIEDAEGYGGMRGTVIEGLVHRRHILNPMSGEYAEMADILSILPPNHPEREKTLRPGATVHIQNMQYFDDDNDTHREVPSPGGLKGRGRA